MKIGVQELLIVLIIVIVLFGPTNIPKLAKIFGKSSKKLQDKRAENEAKEESEDKE